jgi:hypothetical protein
MLEMKSEVDPAYDALRLVNILSEGALSGIESGEVEGEAEDLDLDFDLTSDLEPSTAEDAVSSNQVESKISPRKRQKVTHTEVSDSVSEFQYSEFFFHFRVRGLFQIR